LRKKREEKKTARVRDVVALAIPPSFSAAAENHTLADGGL
jgi:hypothetical protein